MKKLNKHKVINKNKTFTICYGEMWETLRTVLVMHNQNL